MRIPRIYFVLAGVALLFSLAQPTTSTAAPRKGEAAPPIKVVTTSGQQVTLANYKGYVLVIDFFATWCPPCKESIPHLAAMNRKYGKQGLQVLGANVDENGDNKLLREFIAEHKINYPVAAISEDQQADYGIRSIPAIYIINKKGVIAEKFMGFSDETARSMEAAIKRLLAE